MFYLSLQLISSITEGVSTAESAKEEPMQTDEAPAAESEPAPAEEAATSMETQAEVSAA